MVTKTDFRTSRPRTAIGLGRNAWIAGIAVFGQAAGSVTAGQEHDLLGETALWDSNTSRGNSGDVLDSGLARSSSAVLFARPGGVGSSIVNEINTAFEIDGVPDGDSARIEFADGIEKPASALSGDVAFGTLSSSSLDRSARIVVTGTGFGDGVDSVLLIDGLPAIVTDWTATRIVGYVPEDASLGEVGVVVSTPNGDAEALTLEVRPRTQDGRVRWRFAVEGDYMNHAPGIGPNGEIYINDLEGRLYALSADGGLMWVVDALRGQVGGGSEGRVVVGPDGTIFVGVNPLGPTVDLVAYNPDGTLRWVHTDPGAVSIGAGPTIGPDGDVYICYEGLNGPAVGLVRLTPEGGVLWTNNGEPTFWEQGGLGADIAFAPDELGDGPPAQAVVTFDLGSQRRVYGFDLADGDQRFAVGANNLDASGQTQPVVGLDGTLAMPESAIAGAGGWGLQALDPSDGSEMWVFDPQAFGTITNPTVGVDGSFYFAWDGLRINKVSPNGEEEWLYVADAGSHRSATPSPANDVLIATGIDGATGIIRAVAIDTPAEVFLVELPAENQGVVLPTPDVVFTEDGATAYVPAFIAGDHPDTTYAYVYAIATGEPCNPADIAEDFGVLDLADVNAFIGGFAGEDAVADLAPPMGVFDLADVQAFISSFSAGCP